MTFKQLRENIRRRLRGKRERDDVSIKLSDIHNALCRAERSMALRNISHNPESETIKFRRFNPIPGTIKPRQVIDAEAKILEAGIPEFSRTHCINSFGESNGNAKIQHRTAEKHILSVERSEIEREGTEK